MKNFLSCLGVKLWLFSTLTGSYELNAVAILLLWFPSMASTMGFPDNIANLLFRNSHCKEREVHFLGQLVEFNKIGNALCSLLQKKWVARKAKSKIVFFIEIFNN